MATFNKFNIFVKDLGLGAHNLSTGALSVYFSNAVPDAAADAVKTDLAEIATGTVYTGPIDTQNTFAESGGTATVTGTAITLTASGSSIATFQYVVLFNDTHASDALIGWWDYGSALSLATGDSIAIKFNNSATTGTILTIA